MFQFQLSCCNIILEIHQNIMDLILAMTTSLLSKYFFSKKKLIFGLYFFNIFGGKMIYISTATWSLVMGRKIRTEVGL